MLSTMNVNQPPRRSGVTRSSTSLMMQTGKEAEREVPDPIVVVARQVERLLRPVAERRLGVGVVAAVHQHQRVQEDGDVAEVAERQPPVGRRERDVADQRGRDLEQPVQAARPAEDQGQHQYGRHEREQRQRNARVVSCP